MKKQELIKYRNRSKTSSVVENGDDGKNDQEELYEKGMLDQFYFDSIKNKLKLLDK